MKYFVPVLFSFFLFACGENKQTENKIDSGHYDCIIPPPDSIAVDSSATTIAKECYRFDKGEEHNWIELNTDHDSAWGNLHYTWEGKDGAHGDFTGKIHGDTLWLMYYAMMEGSTIPREVAFLKKDGKLFEAQGTQKENAKGAYYYQYKKMLEYSDPHPMVKGPCM